MSNKKNHIFLNLMGMPDRPDSMYLSHGHGYYAYVSTEDTFIYNLFKDICIWGGSTDTYKTKEDGYIYNQFELDCRDRAFFTSNAFKKICQKHDIELTIFENGSDNQIIMDFWSQMVQIRWG